MGNEESQKNVWLQVIHTAFLIRIKMLFSFSFGGKEMEREREKVMTKIFIKTHMYSDLMNRLSLSK